MRPPIRIPQRASAGPAVVPQSVVDELLALLNAGHWDALAHAATKATQRYPRNLLGWKILGSAQFQRKAFADAVNAQRQFLRLAPDNADVHNELACALRSLGKHQEAEASFKAAIQIQPDFAMAHGNYGGLLSTLGRFAEAEASLQQSLALNPRSAATYNSLTILLNTTGRLQEAQTHARRALELNPDYFEAWMNLANVQTELTQWDDAATSFRQAIRIRPDASQAHLGLGVLHAKFFNLPEEAKLFLQRAIDLNPQEPDTYVAMGNIYLQAQQMPQAWEWFKRAQELNPFITRPAKKLPADFSLLLLDAPGAGSTPMDYLIGNAPYDCYFHCVMPHGVADTAPLRSKADVVFNMISDADNGHAFLPVASDLADGVNRPTINHPAKIMHTSRAAMARLLANVEGCKFPKTLQFSAEQLLQGIASGGVDGFNLPLIIRVPGIHGGDDMAKVEQWDAVAQFVNAHAASSYYLIEYVDYRSADGLFRKYRFINVGGELFPYHLAIHNDWLVHHFRTDMGHHPWMRAEEVAFLRNPEGVFNAQHMQALRALVVATQLDYSGIDCALDLQGQLLIFETNASMLVHDEKDAIYAYKNPYIDKIKRAFNALLAQVAASRTS